MPRHNTSALAGTRKRSGQPGLAHRCRGGRWHRVLAGGLIATMAHRRQCRPRRSTDIADI
ncbi:hypothetical protein ACFQU2_07165 [Siccirubricoccus deserti]